MIVFIMTVTFLIPVTGILCVMTEIQKRQTSIVNAILAIAIALFNIAHAFMELPCENCGQCVVLPLMIVIGACQAYYSVRFMRSTAKK